MLQACRNRKCHNVTQALWIFLTNRHNTILPSHTPQESLLCSRVLCSLCTPASLNEGCTPQSISAPRPFTHHTRHLVTPVAAMPWTALDVAAVHGDVDRCSQLIRAGACVHAADKNGSTPLHKAAENGRDACVSLC